MGPRRVRLEAGREFVMVFRFLIVTLEFVRVAQLDPRFGISRRDSGGLRERLPGGDQVLAKDFDVSEPHPRDETRRGLRRRLRVVFRRAVEVRRSHGAIASLDRGWRTTRRRRCAQERDHRLTTDVVVTTMATMTPETLTDALKRAPGIDGSKNTFRVAADHRVAVYLGTPGQAMIVGEVETIALAGAIVEITTREASSVFVAPEHVAAISVRAPSKATPKRAGFE